MAETAQGQVVSFPGNSAVPANRVVSLDLTIPGSVGPWVTQTAQILGVSSEDCRQTGSALAVQISGIAKIVCNASVTVGELVGPVTDTGGKIAAVDDALTTTAALLKVVGIALENGSANQLIRVALNIENRLQLG